MNQTKTTYADKAGFVAERPCGDGMVVLYDRDNGGDWIASDDRWIVVHEPHGDMVTVRSKKSALALMRAAELNGWLELS